MLTKLILPAFLLLLLNSVQSQVALQNQVDPRKYSPYEIKIKSSDIKNNSRFYIKIIDSRADSNRLGFASDNKKDLFFHLKGNPSAYLFNKINQHKEIQQKDTIYILLKKLWCYESFVPYKAKLIDIRPDGYLKKNNGRIEAEVYQIKNESCISILQYDSTIQTGGYMPNNVDYLLTKNLNILLQMADSLAKIDKNRALLTEPVPLPPILQTDKYEDGIFLNFSSFVNNKPSAVEFDYTVKKKIETLELKAPRADDSLYSRYNWGFCKNGELYMRIGPSYSKLTRIENSFELRSVDIFKFYIGKKIIHADIADTGGDIAFDMIFTSPVMAFLNNIPFLFFKGDNSFAKYENIAPYKLDLATGELY